MSPEMTKLIRDLGIRYDPEQLKQVLKKRGGEVRMRAVRVSAALAAFLARIAKVQSPAYNTAPQCPQTLHQHHRQSNFWCTASC